MIIYCRKVVVHYIEQFYMTVALQVNKISNFIYQFQFEQSGIQNKMSGVVSIQGNLGAGKSTLLGFLNVETIKEPVDLWENVGGINILEKYYDDPKRWGFTFQLNALHSRTLLWREAIKKQKNKILFSERSPLADRFIFGQIMNKNGNFQAHQYEIYDSICHTLIQNCPIKGIVYLKCSPQICLERIKIRNRKGEEQISLDYIQGVHQRHEEWINRQKGTKILTIDTGVYDIYNEHHQLQIKKNIMDFVQGLKQTPSH